VTNFSLGHLPNQNHHMDHYQWMYARSGVKTRAAGAFHEQHFGGETA
jgi:hypothetical protein